MDSEIRWANSDRLSESYGYTFRRCFEFSWGTFRRPVDPAISVRIYGRIPIVQRILTFVEDALSSLRNLSWPGGIRHLGFNLWLDHSIMESNSIQAAPSVST
ncbi:hypothetical protein RRG08_037729 [Elysia crispata]|uniref:Uncharacterized protein n=1 Tax=Elysia crispata TaxID=231223 RepID=A0AAE1DUE2_9GAST|nr:hypothetical protein RRG08_037729 [Elysia crispata]